MRMRYVLYTLAILGNVCAFLGCDLTPTYVKTRDATSVPVAIRVLETRTEVPIFAATVYNNAVPVGLTDQEGVFTLVAYLQETVTLQAQKAGYAPSVIASGEISSDHERWTFFLFPLLP